MTTLVALGNILALKVMAKKVVRIGGEKQRGMLSSWSRAQEERLAWWASSEGMTL